MPDRRSSPSPKTPSPGVILGIDIGGTKISVCTGTQGGEILASNRFPTRLDLSPLETCDRIARAAKMLTARIGDLHPVVGVSAPGPLSSRRGVFVNPPNMPGWHGFPVVTELEKRLGLGIRLMNDANAAALAEWRFGAGRGTETLIYYTMSTGMGAGLVISGRLHEGKDDMAGEIGHLQVSEDGPVGFGRRGSIEGFCSGPGLAQLAVMKLTQARHEERDSVLFAARKDYRLIDAVDVGEAARKKDPVALDVFAEVGRRLGELSSVFVDLLNPDAIVLGTIGRIHSRLIIPSARKVIRARCHPASARRVKILPAKLGERTGDVAALCAALG
jgi:glucokinase